VLRRHGRAADLVPGMRQQQADRDEPDQAANRPIGTVASSALLSRTSEDNSEIAATVSPGQAHGRGVSRSSSAGTLIPATSSPSGTANPAERDAKTRPPRTRARAGSATEAACELVQLISPDIASEAAASRSSSR
jgi:hypothetical protein